MSDDLFWPPLSGDEGGAGGAAGQPSSYPTRPLGDFATSEDGGGGFDGDGHDLGGDEDPQPRRPRRVGTTAIVALTAFVAGVGGVGVGAVVFHKSNSNSPIATVGSALPATASALTTSPKSYAGIAAKVLPSVVSINVTGANESDTGSGVVLQSDGYILTNNHVIAAASGGGSVSVSFNDGTTASAKVVGADSLDDLAVVKVAKTGLTPASLGNSVDVQVGDPVLAVGSPLGLTGTVTAGIVSALNRPVETQEENSQQQQQLQNPFGPGDGSGSTQTVNPTVIDAIQTDAAINPGNSGGALVDEAGQVIGINSAIASLGEDSVDGSQSGNIGVGFAIPINEARTIANELISTGHASHPLLGVSLEDQTSSSGLDRAIVHSVTAGGPAAKAGIKDGDVITAIDGTATEGSDAVIATIRSHQPGQKVTVNIQRGGTTKTVTATLANDPSEQG
ncbi:MAG TPA: trypsin-like peptidase domain-containing protein [Mycobacteriales bacterium]|jgi:putative serine protease PepD|nr:trypsin-like peptidase domain-containing protein [Mycobacteriales bacterium]